MSPMKQKLWNVSSAAQHKRFLKAVTQAIEKVTVNAAHASVDTLLKRAFMFLEDGDFKSANEYCEKVLDIDPENAQAYLGELMALTRSRKQSHLANCEESFENSNYYEKILKFGDESLISELKSYLYEIEERNKVKQKNKICKQVYQQAKVKMSNNDISIVSEAKNMFESIPDWEDSAECVRQCEEKINKLREEQKLQKLEEEVRAQKFIEYQKKYPALRNKEEKKTEIIAMIDENRKKSKKLLTNKVSYFFICMSSIGIYLGLRFVFPGKVMQGLGYLLPVLIQIGVLIVLKNRRKKYEDEIYRLEKELKEINDIPSFETFLKMNGK